MAALLPTTKTGVVGCALAILLGILAFLVFIFYSIFYNPTRVTVTLLSARGLDADKQTRAVEFDVAIGFLHLAKENAVAHDGGQVTISYSGVKLAEGPVPKFYVAGGPRHVEATRAVAMAEPLSHKFRDYLQVREQLDGKAEFEVYLSFFDAHDVINGDTMRSHYHCTAGLMLQGKAAAGTICGKAESFPKRYYGKI